jgi:hypothetical protein
MLTKAIGSTVQTHNYRQQAARHYLATNTSQIKACHPLDLQDTDLSNNKHMINPVICIIGATTSRSGHGEHMTDSSVKTPPSTHPAPGNTDGVVHDPINPRDKNSSVSALRAHDRQFCQTSPSTHPAPGNTDGVVHEPMTGVG